MYKTLIAALVVLISTFSMAQTTSTSYSAQGTWEGLIVNNANPKDILRVKFSLYDFDGMLIGQHWYYKEDWEYVGSFLDQRAGTFASWTLANSNGFIEITGTFNGNIFKGTYKVYLNRGSSLYSTLYLRRTSNDVKRVREVPKDIPENLPNFFSVPR